MLFRGEQAHESLMLRVGELLRALALAHRLDMTVLDALWDAGFHQREAAALACLVDVIHIMEVHTILPPLPTYPPLSGLSPPPHTQHTYYISATTH